MGIPVSCEVDIYGTLSEFIGTVVSKDTVTLLDINNTVPKDMYESEIKGKFDYTLKDTFMGFHCGNTASTKLAFCSMKYQMIMARTLPEEVTQGTLEGDIVPGDITFYRLQSTSDAKTARIHRRGRGSSCSNTFLRKHRYLRYSGDGQILPPRTGREKLSASRRSSIRTLRKTVIRSIQNARC